MSVSTTPEDKRMFSESSPSNTLDSTAGHVATLCRGVTGTPYGLRDDYNIRQAIDRHRSATVRIDIELTSKSSSPCTDHESLKSKRAEHMEAFEHKCRLLSPTGKVPAELLRMIFLYSLPDIDERDPQVFANDAPYVFMEVCKKWGEVASNYPSLWTRIVIKAPRNTTSSELRGAKLSNQASAIQTWISRSGDLPLSIYINDYRIGSEWNHPFPLDAVGDLFRVTLAPSMHRWKEICGRVGIHSEFFEEVLGIGFPFLCKNAEHCFNRRLKKERKEKEQCQGPEASPKKWELTLSRVAVTVDVPPKDKRRGQRQISWTTDRQSYWNWDRYQLWHLQSLRDVELPLMPKIASIKETLPFWSGLTTLWNVWATPIEVYLILKGCPSLEIAGFACPELRRVQTGYGEHQFREGYALLKSEPIEVKALKMISFSNYRPWNLNPLCSVVTFSAVSELTLINTQCRHRRKNKCSRRPYRIISDLGSKLTKIHLEHICVSSENMLSYLKQLTNVTHLSILYPPGKSTKGGKFYYRHGFFDSSHLHKITPAIRNASILSDAKLDSVDSILEEAEKFEDLLLPKLTSLTCDFLYPFLSGPRFEEEDILKFMQARRKPNSTLRGAEELKELVFKCQVISTTPEPDAASESDAGKPKSEEDSARKPRSATTMKNLANALQGDVDLDGLRATGNFLYVSPAPLGSPQAKTRHERVISSDSESIQSDFTAIPGGSIPLEYTYTPHGSEWGDSERDSEVTEVTEVEEEEDGGLTLEDEEGEAGAQSTEDEDEVGEEEETGSQSSEDDDDGEEEGAQSLEDEHDEHKDTRVEGQLNQNMGSHSDDDNEYSQVDDEGWNGDDESTDGENEDSSDEHEE